MNRFLLLPLLLLGFAASAQTAPTDAGPRIGLSKPTNSPALNMKPAPMYVVDGQIIESSALFAISPDQIESISLIKPQVAAASLGPRVKNGMVIITTKPTTTSR